MYISIRRGQGEEQISRPSKLRGLEVLSAFSGVLIALQSRINGELSDQMGDSLEAALVSFGTGLIFVSIISLWRKDVREGFADIFKAVVSKQLPMWRLSAGMLGASFVAMQTAIGTGYQNSNAIVAQTGNVADSSAAVAARAYQGNSLTDWYLPSRDELNQMCKWARGITGDALTTLTTVCTGGTSNSGEGASGFLERSYWSSSESSASKAWVQRFFVPLQYDADKNGPSISVRPVRAF